MQRSHIPPVGRRPCPMCALPMFLAHIEPPDDFDQEERIFECDKCAYSETAVMEFRELNRPG